MGRPAKKASKKVARSAPKRRKTKDVDLQEVRKRVRNEVLESAEKLVRAVIAEAVAKAQAQQMKTLFEMIGLFGADAEPDAPVEDDQALAKVLLDRFNLPDVPEEPEERAPLVISPVAVAGPVE
jgi:hypothetical protein